MKKISLLILSLALLIGLSACAANSAPPQDQMNPITQSPLPGATSLEGSPAPNDNAVATGAMTGPESSALSKKANDAATRISEINSCVTAIIGDTCVAGVQFDPQYKGLMTDRIRDMVTSRIQSAAPDLGRIAITADPQISAEINDMAEKIGKSNQLGELTGELNTLIGKIP